MIWFDRAQRSVVAGCSECHRREVFTTQGAADSWAVQHSYGHDAGARLIASLQRRHARTRD